MPRIASFEFVRRRAPLACAFIVACGLLVACGSEKNDSPDSIPTAIPTQTVEIVPTALTGPPRLSSPVWTNAIAPETNAPVDTTPVIGDTVIYAVFPIESLPAGSQLLASWFFNDTSLDALDSAMRIDRDRVSGWVEFHIERTGPDPWPDGVYKIIVSDGTRELQRSEIAIS
ncbi:MAG: hypothetical protein IT339_09810 [Thermomicrobiales bacterium]|nr:hypothetical protein [Thermomicrobiales bacterium]